MTKVVKLVVAGLVTAGAWALALAGNKTSNADCEEDGMDVVETEAEDVIEEGDIA